MTDEELPAGEKDYGEDLYKKWFRTGASGGFLSLRPWWDAGKLSVDIGEIDAGGGLKGHTNVWVGVIQLSVYLSAVANGVDAVLFPANAKAGLPSPGMVYYGGAMTESGPVSRILKIHHWMHGDGDDASFDKTAFVWKTGIFEGRRSQTGAFIPDMSKPARSQNMIKASLVEMAEMAYRLDVGIRAFAAQTPDWATRFNGKKKDK